MYIPAPSNMSPLDTLVNSNVASGDLLEGPNIYIYDI